MIITQDTLIQEIAAKEDIETTTVRKILKSAENTIFDCLSSISPSENITIKIFNGISINRKYIDQRHYSKGMFQNITCPEHVKVKMNSSNYYNKQINQKLFKK